MMIAYLIIITLVTTLIQSQEAQVGPRKPLRAIAIIHGEMDGSSIEGLVKFTQLVCHFVFIIFVTSYSLCFRILIP